MVGRRVKQLTAGGIASVVCGFATQAFTNIPPITGSSRSLPQHLLVSTKGNYQQKRKPSLNLPTTRSKREKKRIIAEFPGLKMTEESSDSPDIEPEQLEQKRAAKEEQPLVSWGEDGEDAILTEEDDMLLDDYCSVMDDFGCKAYEDLAKSLDEKVYRWIRVEARPDESISNIKTQSDVLAKIEEVRSQQTKFGPSDLYKRKWRTLRETDTMVINGDRSQQKTSFSVLQFNVLAEGLSSGPGVKTPFPAEKKSDDSGEDSLKNNYGGFSQIGHPDICLDFPLRRWRLLEVILGLPSIEPFEEGKYTSSNYYEGMFDILAMEEMDRFRGFFAPLLRLFGYEGIFMPKTKSPGVPLGFYSDGCALFWKTTMFELVAEERFQFVVGNQVMMLATLRHRETGNPLLVAVTHLKAQKSDTNEMIRCKQVDELLKHVHEAAERLAKEDGLEKVQILIVGDFNADPPQEITSTESSVRRVLSNRQRTTDDGAAKDAPKEISLKFSSAYPVDPPPTNFYTTYKKRGNYETKRVIDYIFYSDALECVQTLGVPPVEELEGGLLPGLRYPSDHLMIAARFEVS